MTGGTLTGPIDALLTVYDDGQAIYSTRNGTVPEGLVCIEDVGAAGVDALQQELRQAGVLAVREDEIRAMPDLPLTTVTFFFTPEPAQVDQATTFSYVFPTGNAAQVDDVILAFVEATFEECS